MVVPIADEATEQIGTAEQRAVTGRLPAEDDVVTAAGARVPAIQHELFGAETRLMSLVVDDAGVGREAIPVRGWVDIDLDDAGIRRDLETVQAMVAGRRVALELDGKRQLGGSGFDGGHELKVVFEVADGRHEDEEP